MTRPPASPVIIVGAGLAGLACAHALGGRALVLERERFVGGVARSTRRQGFTFDVTGHWLHLADGATARLVGELMGGDLARIERRAAVHSRGVTTAYPFQANTFGRPPEVVAECVLGYFRAREEAARGRQEAPRSLDEFIRQRLGDGIARHFMIPYNTKLWTVAPSELSAAWCERFVPTPAPEDVVAGALSPSGAGHRLGYNASFLYPREGGIGALAERLRAAAAAEVRLGSGASRVDWRRRELTTTTGERLGYRVLVSTAPLPDLVAMLVDAPERVLAAGRALAAASVTYWDVGLAGPNRPDDAHWTYYPDAAVPFYRAGSGSAAMPGLAPAGHRSLYVEVSHRRGTPVAVSDAEVLAGLRSVGLVGADEAPVLMERATIDCAYVIMDRAYGEARATVLDFLEREHILSVGRYGAWTYDSMEGAIIQGRRAAARCRELA